MNMMAIASELDKKPTERKIMQLHEVQIELKSRKHIIMGRRRSGNIFVVQNVMFTFTLTLLVCLGLARSRDFVKPKPVGGLGNSILNFGKMEVNFILNSDKKAEDSLKDYESPKSQFEWVHPSRSHTNLSPDTVEECPCSGNMKHRDLSPNPADLLSKILMSNDLFSNKDPISSNQCCTSHEQIQEEFYIEFSPKQNQPPMPRQLMPQNTMFLNQPFQSKGVPYIPFLTDAFFPVPNKQVGQTKSKSKAIEIFFFPTKKTVEQPKLKPIPVRTASPEIRIVGDKMTTMLIDLIPPKSSVKKDLTQDKLDIELNTEEPVKTTVSENTL